MAACLRLCVPRHGERCSALVETGHPLALPVIEAQLQSLFASGAPPLRYVFPTHTETPHASGIGRLLHRYPDAVAVGDVSDLHLVFPGQADRMQPLIPGDRVDLGGGVELLVVEAVFRDMISTRWAFDISRKVLFTGDGMAYTHYHEAGHCAAFLEEGPDLVLRDAVALFAEFAFVWTTYVDIEPFIERLDEVIVRELGATMIAPTHGLPISDLATSLPKVYNGLRQGSASRRERQADAAGSTIRPTPSSPQVVR